MSLRRDLHEENRASWNEATRAHNSHKRDQAGFLRGGGTTLFPEELELLGDVRGRSLLHLQCNSGQDTLSLAALGARVTGVDISDEAIAFARTLSADSGIPGTFERADVYDWLAGAAAARRRFDVVFTSYGALGWLSDLPTWARGVAGVLAASGRAVVMEFHPALFLFDEEWRVQPFYDAADHAEDEGVNDYVALSGEGLVPMGWEPGVAGFVNPNRCHSFRWTTASLVQALADAGLAVRTAREWPYSNGWCGYRGMGELPGRRFVPPAAFRHVPLMLGVVAAAGPERTNVAAAPGW